MLGGGSCSLQVGELCYYPVDYADLSGEPSADGSAGGIRR